MTVELPRPRLLLIAILGVLTMALTFAAPPAEAKPGKGEPRLSVVRISSPPERIRAGKSFRVEGKVRNRGRRAGRARIGFELRARGEATRAGATRVGRVEPQRKRAFRGRVRVPRSLAPSDFGESGPFKLVACIERQGKRGKPGKPRCRKARGALLVTGGDPPGGFRPGARSLGDPLFPQIGNGGYDALLYSIDLDYDPATNSFAEGTETTITAAATQNLSELSLDFQELEVSAVEVDGEPARFQQVEATPEFSSNPAVTQPRKLIITPASGIPDGEQFSVQVSYSGTPEQITDADESIEGWIRACRAEGPPTAESCDGSFTVNEPIGAQSWFPSNNYATDKAAFETAITVPTGHTALGVGELESRTDNGDGTTTWSWTEDDPTATYLTTGTVGLFDYDDTQSFTELTTGGELPIYEAIDSAGAQLPSSEPGKTRGEQIRERVDRVPGMTNFLSERFGAYPFDSTGVVADWVPGVGYALENQTKAHFAGSSAGPSVGESILLHEVAHQWMGNSVSPATWEEIWFNEGWATFAEVFWGFRANDSSESPEQFFERIYATPEEEWSPAPANLGDPANLFAGFPVYDRPAAMLEGYRQIVGESRFFAFARALLNRHGYDVIDIEQFISAAKQLSGFEGAERRRLEEYFRQWLEDPTKPSLTPTDF